MTSILLILRILNKQGEYDRIKKSEVNKIMDKGIMELETEQLILRRFSPDDWQDLYAILSDPEVVKFEPYGPFSEEASKTEAVSLSVNEAFWAVCLKESGKVTGRIYLNKNDEYNNWELGYILGTKYQKKGYATEACEKIIDYAFNIKDARRIAAYCNPLNEPSWKLLERLGFRREGHLIKDIYFKKDDAGNPIWSDTYEYAILAEEYKKSSRDK